MNEDIRLNLSVAGTEKSTQNVKNFQKTVNRSLTDSERTVAQSMRSMVGSFVSIAGSITLAKKAISTGVDFNKFVESSTTAFTVMMKSASAAKDKIEELYQYSITNPLTFKETVSASRQLMAYGFGADELTTSLDLMGTVAKATGLQLGDLTYVYGTLKAQGRAYSRDLMQFGMRGIPIYEELAKVMGVGVGQIQKLTAAGKVGFKEVERAFQNMTGSGGRYFGMLETYMDTLEGKLDIFTNIFEKRMGDVMSSLTDEYKKFVVGLTETISSSEFEKFTKGLTEDIGDLAEAFFSISNTLIELMPTLVMFLKTWAVFKALGIAKNVLGPLPYTLVKIANGILDVTMKMGQFNVAQWGANIAGAFNYAVKGVMALSKAFVALIAANPWLLIVAGLAGVAVAVGNVTKLAGDARRSSSTESDRKTQLVIDRINAPLVKPEEVRALAEEYNLTLEATKNILINMRALDASAWNNYLNTESTNDALKEQKRIMEAIANADKRTKEQRQADFLSDLTGTGNREVFMDYSDGPNNDYALGRRGAVMYLEGFQKTFEQEKSKWKELFTPERQEELWKNELASIEEKYTAFYLLFGEEGLEKSGFGPALRARMAELTEFLSGAGGAVEDMMEKMSWTAREWATKVTKTQIDDIELTRDKALYAVEEEYKERIASAKKLGKDTTSLEMERIRTIANATKFHIDEVEKYKRDQVLETYNIMANGDSKFWDDMRVRATEGGAGGVGAAAIGGLEGTDVGSLMAGADPITMIITRLVEFLSQLENVNKSLNFLQTAFESMGVFTRILNDAFHPFVLMIEQIAEEIANILAPFTGLFQILTSLWYGFRMWILIRLQILGEGFAWFHDNVIFPVGNAIINTINGIIKLVNKIPGVNIKYLGRLKKTTDALDAFSDSIRNMKDGLSSTINYLTDALNSMVDDELKSLQDLYNVGAISGAEYERMATEAMKGYVNNTDLMISQADRQLAESMNTNAILARLATLADAQVKLLDEALTEDEQERILDRLKLIDASQEEQFRDAVYGAKANTSLGTTPMYSVNQGTGQTTNVYVNVEGSVKAENDLATTIAQAIYKARSRGLLTV